MISKLKIEDKNISIYHEDMSLESAVPVVILNAFDEDVKNIFDKIKEITVKKFVLVVISNVDWNREMSPWYMEKLYKSEDDYAGKADEYLDQLTQIIIPNIEKELSNIFSNQNTYEYIIAGYSLAGLFAIYSLYKTDIFSKAVSCSGSLWYPDFIEFVKSNHLKRIPQKVYFSLGNKESKTKNVKMSTVEEKTKEIESYFHSQNIETIYEENDGNHFQDVENRIAKGIAWVL